MKMLALSLWQPWASLVALRVKRCETRSWSMAHRGHLLIHAARRKMDDVGLRLLKRLAADRDSRVRAAARQILADPAYGALGCRVTVMDCRPTVGATTSELEWSLGDWRGGRYALEMGELVPFAKPISCRGRQGLWMQDVPNWVHDAFIGNQRLGASDGRGCEERV